MRWETVKASAEQEIYNLYKDDEKRLTLVYNPFSNSARVECNREKRVFLIRKEGFRRNKTVIRSEYGIKIGEFGQENKQQYIEVNNEKFFYSTRNNPLAELFLFKADAEQPVVSCGLTARSGMADVYFKKDKTLGEMPHPGLLMALCWYMFLPVAKENIAAMAL
ncbi:MAG TPA: hypothetical protein PLO99_12355 [Chitinophagaceae bacterium]|nr:hypothetical protein [Chitinophagaceae bacterium]HRG92589.1 hypothetical protein [Chitinophagaceae bacterium]